MFYKNHDDSAKYFKFEFTNTDIDELKRVGKSIIKNHIFFFRNIDDDMFI
jgi:hypothetical protein